MEKENRIELKAIFALICVIFLAAMAVPLCILLRKSFLTPEGAVTFANYVNILHDHTFLTSLAHSFAVSGLEALITVVLGFFLAYGMYYTRISERVKSIVQVLVILPMFLPTLTYGFAVIYSFGKQGLITKLLGTQLFDIYGFKGLLISYIIYTLPPTFILLSNAFRYVDKHFIVVSKLMGDSPLRSFYITSVRPMIGAIASAFILSFFLSFTDFGIPASIGGQYKVVAIELYNVMMGAAPDFFGGSAIAVVMLIPSIVAVWLLHICEKFNFRYDKVSSFELSKDKVRDGAFLVLYALVIFAIFAIFAIMFVVPFIKSWPYQVEFTTETLQRILSDISIRSVYVNTVWVAAASAVIATILAYMAALVNARSRLPAACRIFMDAFAMVTNTVPGMVLGVAFLFAFSGTPLQNTFLLIIILNAVREFTTPYLMIQASLSKINLSWETTGALMGDSWLKTIVRVIIPNTLPTIFQMLSYVFVQAMVTISAIVFIVGAKTMVMTTKITQAQYFEKYDEVFVLSLMIFITNIVVRVIFDWLAKVDWGNFHMGSPMKKLAGGQRPVGLKEAVVKN